MSTPLCLHQAHLRYVLAIPLFLLTPILLLGPSQLSAWWRIPSLKSQHHSTSSPPLLHSTPLTLHPSGIMSPGFQGIATKIIYYSELLPRLSTASHIPFLLPACSGRPQTGWTLKLFEGTIVPETVFWLWIFDNINHH